MKAHEYRGVEYTLHAIGADWYGTIDSLRLSIQARRRTKKAAVEAVRAAIDLHLDCDGNESLGRAVHGVASVIMLHADGILDLPLGVRPTARQLAAVVDKILLLVKRDFETDARVVAAEDKSKRISKLRRMTVANGASEGEAANARSILEKLGA